MIQHVEGEHIPLSWDFLSHLHIHLPDRDDELIQLVMVSATLLKADKLAMHQIVILVVFTTFIHLFMMHSEALVSTWIH